MPTGTYLAYLPLEWMDDPAKKAEAVRQLVIPHPHRLGLIHYQTASLPGNVVAEHGNATDPLALPPGGRHLVPGPLADQFPLVLGKREQDVETQPTPRDGGIKLLGD